ncbi:unnamed protein product [Prorocentrum cordatum]|uniref:Uncharacterized protein n=1 Tax=Prorocentrum cordatum TaxID=2364126 RepID=A0ABN9XTC7_9DINO|nr:unnamed protein product [Polarella glacialis]
MSSIQSDGAAGASIDLTPPKSSGDSDAAKLLDSEDSSMTDVSSMGDGIDVEDPMEDGGGCAEDMWEDSPEPRAGALDDASMAPFASSDDSDESVPLGTNKQRQTDSLRASLSVDIETGFDLRRVAVQKAVMAELERRDPKCVVISPPCTWFSQLMKLWNEKRMDQDKRRKLEADAMTMLNFSMAVAKRQQQKGKAFVFEHPHRATSWQRGSVRECMGLSGVRTYQFDLCRYGLASPIHNIPMKKATTFMTNMPSFSAFSNVKCNCTKQSWDVPGFKKTMVKHRRVQDNEGPFKLSKFCQIYPVPLVNEMVRCMRIHIASQP